MASVRCSFVTGSLTVKVAEERLREDASLGQRTSLPVEDIIHLLSFCLKTTQFIYNGTYYQQVLYYYQQNMFPMS